MARWDFGALAMSYPRPAPTSEACFEQMGSLQDYWDLFVLLEYQAIRDGLARIAHPVWQNETYLWVMVAFIAWESLRPWRREQRRWRNGAVLDLFYTVFNYMLFWVLIGTAASEITSIAFRDALAHYFDAEHKAAISLAAMPTAVRYALLLLALDLTSWTGHWMLHRFDVLWEFHKVHHSALELDVMNAGRIHFVEKLFYPLFFYIPMGLIGFEVHETLFVGLFIAVFSTFTHANVNLPLGPLKYILNNPQLHIWHHAKEIDHRRNVNYGDALSIWDYVFRTAYLPDDRDEFELGFDGVEDYPTTFTGQLVAPFRALFHRNG